MSTAPASKAASATAPRRDHEAFLLRLAELLHAHGTPAHRLERVLVKAADAYRIEATFLSTPTAVLVSFGPRSEERTHLLRIEPGATDLGKLFEFDHRLDQDDAVDFYIASEQRDQRDHDGRAPQPQHVRRRRTVDIGKSHAADRNTRRRQQREGKIAVNGELPAGRRLDLAGNVLLDPIGRNQLRPDKHHNSDSEHKNSEADQYLTQRRLLLKPGCGQPRGDNPPGRPKLGHGRVPIKPAACGKRTEPAAFRWREFPRRGSLSLCNFDT